MDIQLHDLWTHLKVEQFEQNSQHLLLGMLHVPVSEKQMQIQGVHGVNGTLTGSEVSSVHIHRKS